MALGGKVKERCEADEGDEGGEEGGRALMDGCDRVMDGWTTMRIRRVRMLIVGVGERWGEGLRTEREIRNKRRTGNG